MVGSCRCTQVVLGELVSEGSVLWALRCCTSSCVYVAVVAVWSLFCGVCHVVADCVNVVGGVSW